MNNDEQPQFRSLTEKEKANAELRAIADEYSRQIMSQRSEILEAFIAKHGCQPEEATQVNFGNRWKIERITAEERAKLREEVIKSAAARELIQAVRALIESLRSHGYEDVRWTFWNGAKPLFDLVEMLGYRRDEDEYGNVQFIQKEPPQIISPP